MSDLTPTGLCVVRALELAVKYGGIDGDHHKAWVIDQMVRRLTGCPVVEVMPGGHEVLGESAEYRALVRDARNGEDGPETYDWDVGICP